MRQQLFLLRLLLLFLQLSLHNALRFPPTVSALQKLAISSTVNLLRANSVGLFEIDLPLVALNKGGASGSRADALKEDTLNAKFATTLMKAISTPIFGAGPCITVSSPPQTEAISSPNTVFLNPATRKDYDSARSLSELSRVVLVNCRCKDPTSIPSSAEYAFFCKQITYNR